MAQARVIAVVRFEIGDTRYVLRIMRWPERGVSVSRVGGG